MVLLGSPLKIVNLTANPQSLNLRELIFTGKDISIDQQNFLLKDELMASIKRAGETKSK